MHLKIGIDKREYHIKGECTMQKITQLYISLKNYLKDKSFIVSYRVSLLSLARTIKILKHISKYENVSDLKIVYKSFENNYQKFVESIPNEEEINQALDYCLNLSDNIEEIYFECVCEEDERIICSFYEIMEGWYYFFTYVCEHNKEHTIQGLINCIILLPLKIIENYLESSSSKISADICNEISDNILYISELNRIKEDIILAEANCGSDISEQIRNYFELDILKY